MLVTILTRSVNALNTDTDAERLNSAFHNILQRFIDGQRAKYKPLYIYSSNRLNNKTYILLYNKKTPIKPIDGNIS